MAVMIAAVLLSQATVKAEEKTAPALPPNAIRAISVRRCDANPLIDSRSSASLGGNINGPSVIKAPAWIKNPLGNFYMYFANHKGKYIRLAYADALVGPWHIYEPGTLRLDQAKGFSGHIASPDVHVDEQKQELRMYFHGPTHPGGQKTGVAISKDGLTFTASRAILGRPYFRVFRRGEYYYAIDREGELSRSKDGVTPFQARGKLIEGMRHAAVLILGDQLLCFYSRIGDSPERIVVATVTLTDDWKEWTASEPIEVVQPEKDYEGIGFPNEPSASGRADNVRQLRDPCIVQEDGHTYLLYSVAGEMGIAMAELEITMKSNAEPEPERDGLKPAH